MHIGQLHGRCSGLLKESQFDERLIRLGVSNSKARDNIRILTMSQTLALSDIILNLFHTSILRSPERDLILLPTLQHSNRTTSLHKKIHGTFSGLITRKDINPDVLLMGK